MSWELGLIFAGLVYLGIAALVSIVLVEEDRCVSISLFTGIMWFPLLILEIYWEMRDD